MQITAENQAQVLRLMKSRRFRLWSGFYKVIDERGFRVPFIPNEVQTEIFNQMWWQNVILKSRQHGATTFIQMFILDDTLHSESINSAVVAHKREEGSKIFQNKLKYGLLNLPEFMLEQTEILTSDKNTLSVNNAPKGERPLLSNIYVTTSPRSSTIQNLHISEHGHLCTYQPAKAEEVKSGALNALHAGSRLFIESTAEGPIGDFYDSCIKSQALKAKGSELSRLDRRFFFFPWFKDKRNAEPPTRDYRFSKGMAEYFTKLEDIHKVKLSVPQKFWYAKKSEEQGRLMKKEHPSTAEEAFEAIIEGAIYGEEIERALEEERWGNLPYDPKLPVYTIWDIGRSTGNAMVVLFVQFDGFWFRHIDYYYRELSDLEEACRYVTRKEYHYGAHYGPWDIGVTEVGSGKTRAEQAAEYGVEFEMERHGDKMRSVVARSNPVDRYEQGRQHMKVCQFDVDGLADRTIVRNGDEIEIPGVMKCLKHYRHIYDESTKTWSKDPVHDWSSNVADTFGVEAQVAHLFKSSLARGKGRRGGGRIKKRNRPRAAA